MAKQQSLSPKDMSKVLQFLYTGKVNSEGEGRAVKHMLDSTVTLRDVVTIVKAFNAAQSHTMTIIMEQLQIQSKVLEQLGAKPEDFNKAAEELAAETKAMQEQLAKEEDETEQEEQEQEEEPETNKEVKKEEKSKKAHKKSHKKSAKKDNE